MADASLQYCKVCSSPTAVKCKSCKMVSYCNREHQKEDWENHKADCRPVQVKSSLELGRYLEAVRHINAGDVLFSELPLVVGPRPDDAVCLGCYRPSPRERCPRCFWPSCSTSCSGLTDPDHHGAECHILQLNMRRPQNPSDDFFRYDAILPLRCLLLQHGNPKGWKLIMEMEGHMKKRGPNTEVNKQVQEKVIKYLEENFFKFLTSMEREGKIFYERSTEVIQKICGIIDVNALEIQIPNGGVLNGLYPTAYLMEHNCLSNTRHVFQCRANKRFKLTVFANQDIQPGNHISTTYTHVLWGTQQRQDHLRSTKYFTCRCRRCGDPSELGTYFSALKCLAPNVERRICGGSQLPINPLDASTEWKCDKCPTSLTSAQVADLVNMIGGEVDRVLDQKPAVESLQTLLTKLKKLLHKNHYHCFAVMHSLIQLYGREQGYLPQQMNDVLIEKKIKMCHELINTIRAIDPTFSRLALYSSIVEQELASATLILAKRKRWTGSELIDKMKDARGHLTHAKDSLDPERSESSGAKMAAVISATLNEVDDFCRMSGMSL